MSNELKNQLIELISSNDYDIDLNKYEAIRNLITNKNNNDTFNINLINIRMLSISEYNKFIKNGTLDGSITQNDINVWHTLKYNEWYDYPSVNGGFNTTQTKNYSQTFIGELCHDNTSENIVRLDQNNYKCWMFAYQKDWANPYDSSLYHAASSTKDAMECKIVNGNLNNLLKKNQYTLSQSFSVSKYISYYNMICNLTITYINAFRPCFSYKDNNKSIDMYR